MFIILHNYFIVTVFQHFISPTRTHSIKMTKLLEWLFAVGIFLGTWFAVISRHINAQLLEEWMSVIVPLPLFLLALFGVSIVVLCHSRG
jgi:hypothetical protein